MKKTIISLFVVFAASAYGSFMQSKVVDIDPGHAGQDGIIYLENGRVLWLNQSNKFLHEKLESAVQTKRPMIFEFDQKTGALQGLTDTPHDLTPVIETDDEEAWPEDFEPTIFNDIQAARNAFVTMDSRTKSDSQCYNRAHGWAYDLWRTRSINSQKLFLFFTSKYIRAYRYHWWFHVTPMVLISTDGRTVEHTFDRSFTRGPLQVKTWTNIFMKNDAQCRSVTWYDDYRQHQNAEWCYLIRATQYYRTPSDLERLEDNGRQETKWVTSEIRQARRQAFIYWRNYNP